MLGTEFTIFCVTWLCSKNLLYIMNKWSGNDLIGDGSKEFNLVYFKLATIL